MGGYLPFTLDITDILAEGENTLTAAVTDRTSKGPHAYGKQSFTPRRHLVHPPERHLADGVAGGRAGELYQVPPLTPLYDEKTVRLQIEADRAEGANIVVRKAGEVIARSGRTKRGRRRC